jgi:CheY-like chemotaxis protein
MVFLTQRDISGPVKRTAEMARTVLVADDSPTIQKRASGILKGEGIDVATVSNGVAAIKKLPTVNPLLILADVAMPGKDGYEVCDHVKNTAEISHIPVLLIFSDDDPFEEARAMKAHADGRIKKPFDPTDLVAIVKRYLDQSEAAVKAAAQAAARPAPRPEERPGVVNEPVDAEPEIESRKGPDPSSFDGGVAFSQAFGEEPAAAPAPSFPAAAAPEPAPLEAAEPVVEAMPINDYVPAAEPEATAPAMAEEAAPADLPVAESVEPAMVFHAPPEIPEPAMIDEVMNAVDAAAAESAAAPVEAAPEAPSPLPEEIAGSVIAEIPSIAEAPAPPPSAEPEPAAVEAPPVEAAAPAAVRFVDSELVYAVVHKTVMKMSPPALSPQLIEDMARRLAEQITRELESSN